MAGLGAALAVGGGDSGGKCVAGEAGPGRDRREELCGEHGAQASGKPAPLLASFATRSWISATSLLEVAPFSCGLPPLCFNSKP